MPAVHIPDQGPGPFLGPAFHEGENAASSAAHSLTEGCPCPPRVFMSCSPMKPLLPSCCLFSMQFTGGGKDLVRATALPVWPR